MSAINHQGICYLHYSTDRIYFVTLKLTGSRNSAVGLLMGIDPRSVGQEPSAVQLNYIINTSIGY